MTELNETSLSRVWQHFSRPDSNAALLTAFRGEYPQEENIRRNRNLAADVRKMGCGYIFVDGYWIENRGKEDERHVKEDSLLVIGNDSDPNFMKKMHELGNKYSQEAILLKDKKGVNVIYRDGSSEDIGKIAPGEMGEIYTKLRNNKQANTFIFKEERDERGFIERLSELAGIKRS